MTSQHLLYGSGFGGAVTALRLGEAPVCWGGLIPVKASAGLVPFIYLSNRQARRDNNERAKTSVREFCVVLNVQCNAYGQRGQANLKVRKIYGVAQIRYLRCGSCGEEFSERKGTALFNCKISEAQAVSVMEPYNGIGARAALVRHT